MTMFSCTMSLRSVSSFRRLVFPSVSRVSLCTSVSAWNFPWKSTWYLTCESALWIFHRASCRTQMESWFMCSTQIPDERQYTGLMGILAWAFLILRLRRGLSTEFRDLGMSSASAHFWHCITDNGPLSGQHFHGGWVHLWVTFLLYHARALWPMGLRKQHLHCPVALSLLSVLVLGWWWEPILWCYSELNNFRILRRQEHRWPNTHWKQEVLVFVGHLPYHGQGVVI